MTSTNETSRPAPRNLTRQQRLLRRLVPATLLVAGTVGVVAGAEASPTHIAEQPKKAKVFLGKLVLKGGVDMHSSPSQDMSPDEGPSMLSANIIDTVRDGEEIKIKDPRVITKTDDFGNTTLWAGFQEGQDWRYVDVSAIVAQGGSVPLTVIPENDPEQGLEAMLLPVSKNDTATATLNKDGHYMLGVKPVAVGRTIHQPHQQ